MAEQPIPLDFGVTSDPGRHGYDAGCMHWNCYVEPVKGSAKMPAPLHAADGFTLFSTLSDGGACRGMQHVGQFIYGVFGYVLKKVDQNGGETTIGGIPGTGPVIMAHNDKPGGRQIVISVDGTKYLIEADVLSEITDADILPTVSVAFLNQRIIYVCADGTIQPSAVDEATDVSSLDSVSAEAKPDGIVGAVEHLQELWVFGETHIQVFTDTGASTAPLRPNRASAIPKGCMNQFTIASIDADLFWVGNDGVVYVASGYNFQRVSDYGVESSIRTTTDKSTMRATAFNFGGHSFYILSGPDWTWQYNRSTQAWDRRFSYGLDRWRADQAIQFTGSGESAGKVVLGDYDLGKLYVLSRTAYDEAGTDMVWRARTAPMNAYPNRISVDELHLDFVMGVGLNSTATEERTPQVGVRWSDDGGNSWSRQLIHSLGTRGDRRGSVRFFGLGTTGESGRIWEVECSSPVVRTLMNAAIYGDLIGT